MYTLLYYIGGEFIGEREKGICREREKEKCLREEIEEKIGNLTGT